MLTMFMLAYLGAYLCHGIILMCALVVCIANHRLGEDQCQDHFGGGERTSLTRNIYTYSYIRNIIIDIHDYFRHV